MRWQQLRPTDSDSDQEGASGIPLRTPPSPLCSSAAVIAAHGFNVTRKEGRKEGRNEISKIHLAVGGERGKVTLGAASLTSFPGASGKEASERASESCVSEGVRSKEEKPFPSAELKTR